MRQSISSSDHHLRCGGWVNLEFSKGKNINLGWPLKLFTSRSEACRVVHVVPEAAQRVSDSQTAVWDSLTKTWRVPLDPQSKIGK